MRMPHSSSSPSLLYLSLPSSAVPMRMPHSSCSPRFRVWMLPVGVIQVHVWIGSEDLHLSVVDLFSLAHVFSGGCTWIPAAAATRPTATSAKRYFIFLARLSSAR